MTHAHNTLKRIVLLGFLGLLLVGTTPTQGARINSDGSVDPDGCGGFVTTSDQRWIRLMTRSWMPLSAISAVVLSAASSYCYMQDATTRYRRKIWGAICGVTTATAMMATLAWIVTTLLLI